MKIKELQKTVNIAWSPQAQHAIYLAAGTAAQQFDSNGASNLEIYSPNFGDVSYDLELKASLPTPYRFQKLIWSPTGIEQGVQRNGLVVGGCEAGHVVIYSAAKMLAQEENALIARQDKHTGAVNGLDFNPFQTNLLASSASESEIFIWDLNNPTTHMTPGTKTQPLEVVQNVAWNRQVQHILASVFSNRCVIWDLRKSEQIIKLSDTQSRVRWHAIQWHPEMATQVWLASEDDQAPVVQLWDLRYATAPAKTMQIHQRGVLGMSWCPKDTDLMVSCGKDNRIYCWNPNTQIPEGEILSEVATTATWYSDVQWCPRNPALIASSCLDGCVSIYSLFGGTQQQVQTSNKIADSFPGMDQMVQAPVPPVATQTVYHDLKRPPKWAKRPSGAKFGFGGKLVHFNRQSKEVKISQVVTETDLVTRASALERSLVEMDFVGYCKEKADKTTEQNSRYLWYFIKANFEHDPKEEILNLLGYNKDDIQGKFAKYIRPDETNEDNELVDKLNRVELSHQPIGGNEALFDHLAEATQKQQQPQTREEDLKPQFKVPRGEHKDSLIAEAILTGNLEAAVELLLEAHRSSEALIIASTAGLEFLTKIQQRILKEQQHNELSHLIKALVTHDWLDFIEQCTADSWKQALVAALRHGDRKVADLCERLGDRLLRERPLNIEYIRNGVLCYICSESIDKLVSAWYQLKQLEQQNNYAKLTTEQKQELAEIVMLVSKSLQKQGVTVSLRGQLAEFVREYGSLLASQGATQTALEFICALGCSEDSQLTELRELLYNVVTDNANNAYREKRQKQQTPAEGYTFPNPKQPMATHSGNYWTPQPGVPVGIAPNAPTIFNPNPASGMVAPPPSGPPTEHIAQPPRPPSGPGGLMGRVKHGHVLDPIVISPSGSGLVAGGYSNIYNPVAHNTFPNASGPCPSVPTGAHIPQPPTSFNTNPFGPSGGAPLSNINTTNNYMPLQEPSLQQPPPPAIAQSPAPPPSMPNIQRNPTPPPGWNDPPALRPIRTTKKPEPPAPVTAPITHPLYGVDPNQNANGYGDGNLMPYPVGTLPPTSMGAPNPLQNNNAMPPISTGSVGPGYPNYQNSAITTASKSQQQPAPIQQQTRPQESEKPPLPEEYIYLKTILEELKNQCLNTATDPRTKRKFVDVTKRLENLYDCLRDGRLSPSTIQALNQIIQHIQVGDYANALQIHTQIAFSADFAQCSGFMPGLKVLVQSANELQVFLR